MKIIDLLNKGTLSLSFEVFPPKTNANFESVKCAVEEIAKLSPSFMRAQEVERVNILWKLQMI